MQLETQGGGLSCPVERDFNCNWPHKWYSPSRNLLGGCKSVKHRSGGSTTKGPYVASYVESCLFAMSGDAPLVEMPWLVSLVGGQW